MHQTGNQILTRFNLLDNQNVFMIERQHFAVFASWIDKKENLHYNVRNIPYNFNLFYSRDSKCDNKSSTIVVAKINNSEQIVGEYNPLFLGFK